MNELDQIFGIKKKEVPLETSEAIAIDFSQEAAFELKEEFWDLLRILSTENGVSESDYQKMEKIIRKENLDEPGFKLLTSNKDINTMKNLDLGFTLDPEIMRRGLLIFKLPPAVDKRWWKSKQTSNYSKIPWWEMYTHLKNVLNKMIITYEQENGLWLQRANPPRKHITGEYYYVWYIGDLFDKRNFQYQQEIKWHNEE